MNRIVEVIKLENGKLTVKIRKQTRTELIVEYFQENIWKVILEKNTTKHDVSTTRADLGMMCSCTTERLKLLVMKTISKPLIVRQPTYAAVIGPFTHFVSPACIIVACLHGRWYECANHERWKNFKTHKMNRGGNEQIRNCSYLFINTSYSYLPVCKLWKTCEVNQSVSFTNFRYSAPEKSLRLLLQSKYTLFTNQS